MTSTTDKVVLIGERQSLLGIATQSGAGPQAGLPAVVVLNSGIIHRVGHNRMYVNLARELAARGHLVLRLDLSGIGDSESRADLTDPLAAALADVKEAIDWLAATRGVRRVVLMGLCSGANQSVVYAGGDPRVVGVVLLDPSIPRTPRFYLNFFGSRMRRSRYWRMLLLRRVSIRKFLGKLLPKSAPDDWNLPQLSLEHPRVRSFLEGAYASVVAKGDRLLAVFTGGVDDQLNYRGQMLDAMRNVPFGEQLQLEYFEHCDHTFSFAADRRRLFDVVSTWLAGTRFRDDAPAD